MLLLALPPFDGQRDQSFHDEEKCETQHGDAAFLDILIVRMGVFLGMVMMRVGVSGAHCVWK